MASWSEMSGGARAGLVALGVAGVAVVGTLIWRANQPVPVPPESAVTASEPAATSAAPVVDPAPVVAPVVVESVAPSFDNWRVEADGSAVVSGRAEPGAMVTVLVDGRSVAETRASGSGAFALLFTLVANDKPSVMMLEALLADGRQMFSAQTIALAPIPGPAPVDVANAAPAAPPAAVVVTEDTVTVVQSPAEDPAASEVEETAPVVVPEAVPEPVTPAPEVAAAPPAPVAAVVVDAISYNAAGDVLLSGKGQAGQFVRVYLDNLLTATGPIAASGAWQITLVDTAPGIYTLRADQIDTEGKVTARFETPFQRETREALAALAQGTATPVDPPAQPENGSEPVPDTTQASVETETPPTPVETSAPQTAPVQAEIVPDPQTAVTAPEKQAEAAQQSTVAEAAPPEPQPGTDAGAQDSTAQTAAAAQTEVSVAPVVTEAAAPEQPALTPTEPQPTATIVAEASPGSSTTPDAAAAPAEPDAAPGPVPATVSITVQPGYTLWGIARASLGDGILYVQVYNANKDKIKNPDLIYPGQVFTLPVEE